MPSSRDYLNEVKKQIKEISVEDVKKKLDSKSQPLVIDVREPEEVQSGILPHAKNIVRGFLELKIENEEPNRDREMILYCAGGNRSALAAKALGDLGYKNDQRLWQPKQNGFHPHN